MDDQAPFMPHAPSVVSIAAIAIGIGIMVGGVALALAGAWAMSRFVPSPPDAPNNATRPAIAGPVQRSAPPLELKAFLREKNERLEGRGADPRTGEPFVPIDEAMRSMAASSSPTPPGSSK